VSNGRRGGPLEGVRVVELTKVWAGPYVGKLLAFLGAEVIRIESLNSLDVTRAYGSKDIDQAPGFRAVNPQKLSVQIDVKTAEGVALILDLLAKTDVVVENLRPGAIGRLGLGYAAVQKVRPDIVFVSMGMYGSDGPLAYQTGYAPCFAALGGLSSQVGYEGQFPAGMNIRYADSTFGAAAAYATLVALMHRRRTGEGQFVDVSAVECMTSMMGDSVMDFTANGVVHECNGNRHAEMAPHGVYRCLNADWISIAVSSDSAWKSLCEAMDRPTLATHPHFASLADRKAHEDEVDDLISQWTAHRDARELEVDLQKRGVAATKSQSSVDLIADADFWSREFFREVVTGAGQSSTVIGPSWRMTREAAITAAAPALGENNAYVFGEILGLSAAEQQRLAAAGVAR
jgi:crotonobetainyl-CoA:carnitine CoA-transferase CaiB-like acyl-CoA transferase